MQVSGLLYRAMNPIWSQPLSGEGARRFGGRFNARGVAALYTAMDPMTALREASQVGQPLNPTLLVCYEADLTPVFDATDAQALMGQGMTPSDLAADDWRLRMDKGLAPTQAFANRLIAQGFCAMIVPSFARNVAPGARNVVLWRWSDSLPARLAVIDPEGRLVPVSPGADPKPR